MHIAICDDNIADRKQLERLLGRESDKRKADTGVLYCDSYGNSEQLLHNPMAYDLFFLDMTTNKPDSLDHSRPSGLTLSKLLREKGVTAPIVLCPPDTLTDQHVEELLILPKPVRVAALSAILDKAIEIRNSGVNTIELRSDQVTRYVFQDDIIYAEKNGRYLEVHLTDGTVVSILSTMHNFLSALAAFTHFNLISSKIVINVSHITKISPARLLLDNDASLVISPFSLRSIQKCYNEFLSE